MRIDCHVPITLRIIGVPTDEQLAAAGRALTRAVAARLAEAERLLAHRHGHHGAASVEVREAYDPAREVHGGYAVPSFGHGGEPVAVPTRRPAARRFRVRLRRPMSPPQLLREFVRQYYRATDEHEVDRLLPLWRWQVPPGPSATAEDARLGFHELHVTDVTELGLERLSAAERADINAAADDRFRRDNHLAPDAMLGTGPQDAVLRARWIAARAEVLREHDLRRVVAALPEDVRRILFAGGRATTLDDYEPLLRLARKLSGLTPAQRAGYLAGVEASTTDWAELDASVERYLAAERARASAARRTAAAKSTLDGCEDLYLLWRRRNELRAQTAYVDDGAAFSGYSADVGELFDTEAQLREALARHRFADERAFVEAMETYRLRFRDEAVILGTDILAVYDRLLHREQAELRDIAHVRAIVTGIAGTTARADYEAAWEQQDRAVLLHGDESDLSMARVRSLRASADRAVVVGSGGNLLVDPGRLGRGTDLEELARLDVPAAQRHLLGLAEQRLSETATARHELTHHPESVFGEPKLIEAAKERHGVRDNTVYAWIIRDYEPPTHTLALALLALVLAALVPVGGEIAMAALLANTALSTYQVVEAIDDYRQQTVAYRLAFLDDEPSLGWVMVAVAAAALDLHTTVGELLKGSAQGLDRLAAPLREFAAATDAGTAAARLGALTDMIDTVHGLEGELRKALKTHAAAALDLRRAAGRVLSGADPTVPFKMLYHAVRTGARQFAQLRTDARLLALMGDVTGLSGVEREELKLAFQRVKEVVDLGTRREMDEATLLGYVDRLAAERSIGKGAFEELLEDMRAWRSATDRQAEAEAERKAAQSLGGPTKPGTEKPKAGRGPKRTEAVPADGTAPRWRTVRELERAAAKDPEAGQAKAWYDKASDRQLHDREAHDPIAKELLDKRYGGEDRPYRPDRPTDLAMQDRLRGDLHEARQAVETERRRLEEAGLRRRSPQAERRRREKEGLIRPTPRERAWPRVKTKVGEQSVQPTAKAEAGYEGSIAVARSDISALKDERFSDGSPRALGSYDPAHEIRPADNVVPHAHGHAEEALAQRLDERLSRLTDAEREAAQGRTVYIRVDQEVCSICAAGVRDGSRAGVLLQLSARHPGIFFEVTADDTSTVYRLLEGKRVP
ncbi:hypothetical protein ABZT17_35120 [Streptomyces sp. NPDC005648]|uniref:hypothetical protein n=1 Tax=Streptomyces sp. NPDC005648 TaxID=3157044 RepID=UPI0033A6822B